MISIWGAYAVAFCPSGIAQGAGSENESCDRTRPFSQKIDTIVSQVPTLDEGDWDLFDNALMQTMSRAPHCFVSDVEKYLRDQPTGPENKIKVAVLILQKLPLNEYLAFLERLSRLGKGEVNSWALFYAVVPGIEWSTRLALRYTRRDVKEALKKVRVSPNADGRVQSVVEDILSGALARSLKQFNEMESKQRELRNPSTGGVLTPSGAGLCAGVPMAKQFG